VAEGIHGVESISNVYLINTADGDIQINAGMGFEAPTIRDQLAPFRKGPLPYLILTQGHVDHVGGVAQLRAPETKLVAHASNPECQKDDERIMGARNRQSQIWFPAPNKINSELQEKVAFVVQDRPAPDITFEDRMEIDHGGVKLELLSVPGGETVDSIAIHVVGRGIVFTGKPVRAAVPALPQHEHHSRRQVPLLGGLPVLAAAGEGAGAGDSRHRPFPSDRRQGADPHLP
jgi:glyoxylase-like metal-dependent hydrolase (beta-lactamase superfamily II)